MSKVIALIYAEKDIPVQTYSEIHDLQKEGLLNLVDACEVEIKDNGKLKFERGSTSIVSGWSDGFFLPAFVGLLFFHPQHQVNDHVQKTLEEIALDKNFLRALHEVVSPRNSVLFLLVDGEPEKKAMSRISEHGGTLLEMTLSPGQLEKLQNIFRGQTSASPDMALNINP